MLKTICVGAILTVAGGWNAGAQAQALIFETIETVQILHPRDLPVETDAAPRRSFFGQSLTYGGEAKLELSQESEEAFRDKFNLDAHAPFLLADWRAMDVRTGHSSHLGYVYCAARLTLGAGQKASCFRDKDGDGTFDSQTSLTVHHREDPRLTFTDIEPTRYRAEAPASSGKSGYVYAVTLGYTVDKSRSVLIFRARVPSLLGREQALEPMVEVSTSSLPATMEISGARVQVLSWDGKRAKVRVDRQMPIMPISFVSPSGGGCGLVGDPEGCRISFSDVPLPK